MKSNRVFDCIQQTKGTTAPCHLTDPKLKLNLPFFNCTSIDFFEFSDQEASGRKPSIAVRVRPCPSVCALLFLLV